MLLSSLHVTLLQPEGEARDGAAMGLMRGRSSQQFHLVATTATRISQGFLQALEFAASARTFARSGERAQSFGGENRGLYRRRDPARLTWDAFWVFYQDTGRAGNGGCPIFTRAFFDTGAGGAARTTCCWFWPNATGRPVAGALNFIGRDNALWPLLGL